MHYNDKVVNVPAVTQMLIPAVHPVQKTVEVPQMSVVERPYALPQAVNQELFWQVPVPLMQTVVCDCAGGPASSSSAKWWSDESNVNQS